MALPSLGKEQHVERKGRCSIWAAAGLFQEHVLDDQLALGLHGGAHLGKQHAIVGLSQAMEHVGDEDSIPGATEAVDEKIAAEVMQGITMTLSGDLKNFWDIIERDSMTEIGQHPGVTAMAAAQVQQVAVGRPQLLEPAGSNLAGFSAALVEHLEESAHLLGVVAPHTTIGYPGAPLGIAQGPA